jgi:hypothetical protein
MLFGKLVAWRGGFSVSASVFQAGLLSMQLLLKDIFYIKLGLMTILQKAEISSKRLLTGEIMSLGLFYDFESSNCFLLLCHYRPNRSYSAT